MGNRKQIGGVRKRLYKSDGTYMIITDKNGNGLFRDVSTRTVLVEKFCDERVKLKRLKELKRESERTGTLLNTIRLNEQIIELLKKRGYKDDN